MNVMDKKLIELVMGEAAKSNVEKRKVGCVLVQNNVLVDGWLGVVAKGYNLPPSNSLPLGLHAEAMAVNNMVENPDRPKGATYTAYVSHPPCPVCAELLANNHVTKVEAVTAFMKFDGDKLRYDLIPPSSLKALASVLTFGARKYEPNNWRNCEDLGRYVAATMRHFEAYREGEMLDEDSGYPHLWHAMTNLAFLIELDSSKTET